MDEIRADRIETKIDKVLAHVASLDVTVARQEVHLNEHIRRTDINEKAIAYLYKLLIGSLLSAVAWGIANYLVRK